jgi:hypothetical protein
MTASTVRDSASDALEQLQQAAGPAVREGKRQAGVLLDQSGAVIGGVNKAFTETATEFGKSLIAYTKKNPILALALAVGAGALLVSAAKSMRSDR